MRRVAVVLLLSLALSSVALAEGYHYTPGLHGDPFRAPPVVIATPDDACKDAAAFCVLDPSELKVTAVVTGQSIPIAMVEDGKGESRIVKRGDFLGRHRVEEIRTGRVVLSATLQTPAGPVKVSHTLKVE